MAKFKTGSEFDEYFMSAFQFQQSLNEQRNQRVQDITFKMRELSLLDDYRSDLISGQQQQEERLQRGQDFDIRQSFTPIGTEFDNASGLPIKTGEELNKQFGRSLFEPSNKYLRKDLIPETPEPIESSGLVPLYEGQVEVKYETDPTTGERRVVDYGTLFRPFESTISGRGDKKTPYTNQIALDASEDRLRELRNIKPEGDTYSYYDDKGNLIEDVSAGGMQTVIQREEERLKALTDDKARWYNSKWENFDQAYQSFIQAADIGELTLENLDRVINEGMKGAPADVIKEMKSLIKKRVRVSYRKSLKR